MTAPFASYTVTVLPGSAVPVTVVPEATTFVGAFGAVLSIPALIVNVEEYASLHKPF